MRDSSLQAYMGIMEALPEKRGRVFGVYFEAERPLCDFEAAAKLVLLRDFQKRNKAIGERIEARRKAQAQAARAAERVAEAAERLDGFSGQLKRYLDNSARIVVACPTERAMERVLRLAEDMLERKEIDRLPEIRLMDEPLSEGIPPRFTLCDETRQFVEARGS